MKRKILLGFLLAVFAFSAFSLLFRSFRNVTQDALNVKVNPRQMADAGNSQNLPISPEKMLARVVSVEENPEIEKSILEQGVRDGKISNEISLNSKMNFREISRKEDKKVKMKSVRYNQVYNNVPIWGKQLIVISKADRVYTRGNVVEFSDDFDVSTKPVFDSKEALKTAKSESGLNLSEMQFENEKVELMIYVDDQNESRLVYVVSFFADTKVGGEVTRPFFILDAKTKKVLKKWEGLETALVGTGPGGNAKTGKYEYGSGTLSKLDVTESSGTCTMDSSKVRTVNLNGATGGVSDGFSFSCYRNTVKTINGAYSPLNDSHYFGTVAYDMFMSWYGIPPLDPAGDPNKITIKVHYGTNVENAFWNGSNLYIGDGLTRFYPLANMDVVAHEISHGFTDQNSDLIYSDQSGGINESFSDIAGEAAESYKKGTADFLVAAQIMKTENALRYMSNPPLDGHSIDHVSKYTPGMNVHYSSGIYNKVFYILANTSGWTVRKAFEVFLKANQNYWVPNETFVGGAWGVLDAADDAGYLKTDVVNAFAQVGINLSDTTNPSVSITSPTSGTTYTVAQTVNIVASASDNRGVAKVEFYDGTVMKKTDTSSPYSYAWAITSSLNGVHGWTAKAYDTSGNSKTSSVVNLTVNISSGDSYEPDNTSAQAKAIPFGGKVPPNQQARSILPVGDVDWVSFTVLPSQIPEMSICGGLPVLISADSVNGTGSAALWLYGPNGLTPIRNNGDGDPRLGGRIRVFLPAAGKYYIKIAESARNPDTIVDYILSVGIFTVSGSCL